MTTYHTHKVNLSQGQRSKLLKAYKDKSEITIRLGNTNLTGNDSLMLTKRQINKINKAKKAGLGVDIHISKTQIRKVPKLGNGAPQLGQFPSIGVSVSKQKSRRSTTTKKDGGRIMSNKNALSYRSPPFIGTWDQYNKFLKTGGLLIPKKKKDVKAEKKVKKPKFIKKPLSNIDLMKWCKYLKINIKGIYSRDEHMSKMHSPCIINLDSYESFGTHWTCCVPGYNKRTLWYFDSFGMPYPNEFKMRAEKDGIKQILYNSTQYQHIKSVLCGYYCIFFFTSSIGVR